MIKIYPQFLYFMALKYILRLYLEKMLIKNCIFEARILKTPEYTQYDAILTRMKYLFTDIKL